MVVFDEIKLAEEQLLQGPSRHALASKLLAPDFVEFGASGTVWDRDQIIRNLERDEPVRRELDDFRVRTLGPDVLLATYRVRRFASTGELAALSLRSSIWVHRDGRWQMLFHQGTPQAHEI